jgi:hypothetical protein
MCPVCPLKNVILEVEGCARSAAYAACEAVSHIARRAEMTADASASVRAEKYVVNSKQAKQRQSWLRAATLLFFTR